MSERRFPDVPTGYPFPALEQKVLERWAASEIFEKSMAQPAPKGEFVLYEGPPTANNVPHVGHVPSRVTKDLFPRFRTMQGYHVARKAGWDTHGLPVEIEVEKRLGFSGKEEIEKYGIAAFNQACLESVRTYEREWRAMTERLGYWTDLDHAYFTFTNKYIESVWWALSQLHEQGLLSKGYKIQPYCARCGTTLSSHEVAQNYKDVDDPSIWVLFPVRPGQTLQSVDGGEWTTPDDLRLVAWTTTPWTVLAHVGLAVHPDLVYRVVADPRDPERFLLFGDEIAQPVPLDVESVEEDGKRKRLDLRALEPIVRIRGVELEGLRYDRPYKVSLDEWKRELEARGATYDGPDDETGFLVVPGDYVTADEGTGLVHTAPRFGEDDYKTGLTYGLPMLRTIDDEGQVTDLPGLEPFTGNDFKAADPAIIRDLKERGFLLHTERYRHNYPFCWRCDRPLLYYATESWFVNTTRKKERLIELNRTIGWHPEHVGEGRFGNWLENMVDWALSRRRYWGTPLPVWECDACGETIVPGSYAELFERAGRELPEDPYDPEQLNPHRPYIDEMTWSCDGCAEGGGMFRRVEEVIDAWFDSGSMPYAQHHYPFENRDLFEQQFPADLIAEGVDQTRGWFYTLHALAGLLFDSVAYKNCIVLGHINDEDGRKMSKRLGNVLEPMAVIAKTGADALRWYLCISNPELTSRFGERLVRESAQNYLIPLWNALSFFTIYANLDGWRPGASPSVPFTERPALDRWILLRLDRVIEGVTGHLDGYRIVDAARVLEAFVDDLTNWYIRRSRGRFWAEAREGNGGAGSEAERAKESAYQTLYEVLTTIARLTAPFTPFVAEELHERLEVGQKGAQEGDAAESVHLERWPEPSPEREEPALERAMAAAQRIVRLGHAARNTHGLKTRQPLAAVTLVAAEADLPELLAPYEALVADELNVQRIEWAAERADYVHHEVKPHYPKTGPRFGKQMKEVAAALREADGDRLAEALEADGKVTIEVGGGTVELSAEELEVRLDEREGIAAQGDRELLVALDTELTPELIAEGLAREVVNRIQTARKDADLDYADRIRVRYTADEALEAAIDAHRDWIAGETLAVEIAPADGEDAGSTAASVDEHAFAFAITTVS